MFGFLFVSSVADDLRFFPRVNNWPVTIPHQMFVDPQVGNPMDVSRIVVPCHVAERHPFHFAWATNAKLEHSALCLNGYTGPPIARHHDFRPVRSMSKPQFPALATINHCNSFVNHRANASYRSNIPLLLSTQHIMHTRPSLHVHVVNKESDT